MQETRGLDLEEGGSVPSPLPAPPSRPWHGVQPPQHCSSQQGWPGVGCSARGRALPHIPTHQGALEASRCRLAQQGHRATQWVPQHRTARAGSENRREKSSSKLHPTHLPDNSNHPNHPNHPGGASSKPPGPGMELGRVPTHHLPISIPTVLGCITQPGAARPLLPRSAGLWPRGCCRDRWVLWGWGGCSPGTPCSHLYPSRLRNASGEEIFPTLIN